MLPTLNGSASWMNWINASMRIPMTSARDWKRSHSSRVWFLKKRTPMINAGGIALGDSLLQPKPIPHSPLQARLVKKVKRQLFPRKHSQRRLLGVGDEFRRLLHGEIRILINRR